MSHSPSTTSPSFVRRYRWPLAIVGAVLAATVLGPFVYINIIRDDAPDRLTLDDVPAGDDEASSDAAASDTTEPGEVPDGIEGRWVISDGTQVGYRVQEVLFGQDTEGVGRTSAVSGSITIEGTSVTDGEFVVDMATMESDERNRDNQFRGRIMDTGSFPEATFTLAEPIELGEVPADGERLMVDAVGELTLRGVTQRVTIPLTAELDGSSFAVNGTLTIAFDDFEIPDASGGPAQVGRSGDLEILLVFGR